MTYYIVRRTKQNDEATQEFVCLDTEEAEFKDADVLAEIMATEHARQIMVEYPTPVSEGVYQLTTSNGGVVTYLVRQKWEPESKEPTKERRKHGVRKRFDSKEVGRAG